MKRLASLTLGLTSLLLVSVASAIPITLHATLSGSNESPANASPGTGFAIVVINPSAHTLAVHVTFSDLLAGTTASHIHCCTALPGTGTAGVATAVPFFPGFPIGVMSGTYDNTFDLTLASSFNPAFITAHGGTVAGAEAALETGLLAGMAYFNIHTTAFPGGEIRGFLVPEPASLALLVLGLAAFGFARRRVPSHRRT